MTVTIRGETVALSPMAEEMAYNFAKKKDTPYVQDPVFVGNFMKYFRKELPADVQEHELLRDRFLPVLRAGRRREAGEGGPDARRRRRRLAASGRSGGRS